MKLRVLFPAILLFMLFSEIPVIADINADGKVTSGEYRHEASSANGRVILYWTFTDTALFVAASMQTRGWVAIGFGPEEVMRDADMVIGWVETDGTAHILDCFSTGTYGPHPPDVKLGGEDQLISRGAAEKDGVTTVEFSRPVRAVDAFDKDAAPGVSVIWSYANDDNFDSAHSEAGYAVFSDSDSIGNQAANTIIEEIRPVSLRYLGLILPHAIALSLAFVGMLTGMLIARYGKKNKNWLKIHRPLGYFSTVLAIFGVSMGIRLVASTSGIHFRVPHAFLAVFTILTVITAPILGRGMTVWKNKAKSIRKVHRIVGRIAILLMALTITSGLLQLFAAF